MAVVNLALEARTVNQRVYERLRDHILAGGIGLGQRLDERLLAEQMNVSRTPIRDAIGKLVKEGLVEHRAYQGNFVRAFSVQEITDLYELRAELESMAARLAAQRRTDADVAELNGHVSSASSAKEHADLTAYAEADHRFHRMVTRMARNGALTMAIGQLEQQIRLARNVANQDPDTVDRTMSERRRVAAAIKAGDGDRASAAMREHVEGVGRSVLRQLGAPVG
jgi:DNA-binding GntR family transcriptional regulator